MPVVPKAFTMTKHMIALVRLASDMVRLLGALVNFVLREDVQKLITTLSDIAGRFPVEKLALALDLTVRRLEAASPLPDTDPLHDAKYAAERIGVVVKTIGRLTKKGMLPVDSYLNAKRMFRESHIERCRRYYRGE